MTVVSRGKGLRRLSTNASWQTQICVCQYRNNLLVKMLASCWREIGLPLFLPTIPTTYHVGKLAFDGRKL